MPALVLRETRIYTSAIVLLDFDRELMSRFAEAYRFIELLRSHSGRSQISFFLKLKQAGTASL
jgi:hypothetical protein